MNIDHSSQQYDINYNGINIMSDGGMEHLERRVNKLENNVVELNTNMPHLHQDITKLSDSIDKLNDSVNNMQKPNWQNILGVVTLIVACAGTAYSFISSDMSYIGGRLDKIEAHNINIIERVSRLEERVSN